MRNERSKTFLKALSEEFDLPMETIREIVESPYLFHVNVMKHECDRESLTFPSTRVEGLGIFYCPPFVKERLKKINNKKNESTGTE